MSTELTPELVALIDAARWIREIPSDPESRQVLADAIDAFDESVKPQPIDGYLYWDDGYDMFLQAGPVDPAVDLLEWNHVLKGKFVPSERIR